MSTTRRHMLLLTAVTLALTGCQSRQADARRELARRIESRQVSVLQSMEFYRQGEQAFHEGQLEQAEQLAGEALDADDRNVYALILLGVARFEQGKLVAAAEAFNEAGELAPTRYEPHFNLGSVLEAAGQYAPAAREYEKALNIAPNQVEVMENLIRCYAVTGHDANVIQALIERAQSIERRPQWVEWLDQQATRVEQAREQQTVMRKDQ